MACKKFFTIIFFILPCLPVTTDSVFLRHPIPPNLYGQDFDTGLQGGIVPREFIDDPLRSSPPNNMLAVSPQVLVQKGPFVSTQVNVDILGNNIKDDAANEPSIAVNPTNPANIVIGWRQFNTVASNFRLAGWAYSRDYGQTWTFAGALEEAVFRSDPIVDADAEGNIYYYSLAIDMDELVGNLFTSSDGGISWQPPTFAFGGDKPWMVVDKTGSAGRGNIYVIWQQFASSYGSNTFTRSTDGGQTFCDPVEVPHFPSFGTLAVGPEGEVYAAGIRWPFFTLFTVARSTDARDHTVSPSFSATLVDLGGRLQGLRDYDENPNPAGLLGQIYVGVDYSERSTRGFVYVLASVDPPGPDPLDVHFIRSTNGGISWSKPVRVNDDPARSRAWQWFGTLSVAPNGRLDVIWNDTRNTNGANLSELYYAYSHDAGTTWSQNISLTPVFDSYKGWPNQQKIGDYYDMVSDNATVSLAYAATFNGEQDIYFLRLGDCNTNGVHDSQDIEDGTSRDSDTNLTPDECELP